MKIKNLYVADARYLKKTVIIKKPNVFKRFLSLCIGAEITSYKEAITDTTIKVYPDAIFPLSNYVEIENYGKNINEKELKKIIRSIPNKDAKRRIGF